MKKLTAFREQITGYDCVPTSFINAFVYLYERDIPTDVVREIYSSTLDDGEHGTSSGAVEALCYRLNRIHNKKFKVKCTLKKGSEVNFDGAIKTNSCWLICVYCNKSEAHYITAFYKKKNYLYCFDPFYTEAKKRDGWEIGSFEGRCNLKINLHHLKKGKEEKYCSGRIAEREMVVIEKKI